MPRFIPTCVGNMRRKSGLSRWIIGSSPRVWGTFESRSGIPVVRPVHPHVCGEHLGVPVAGTPPFGSSPRVWGTYRAALIQQAKGRFIPTCVGNINSAASPGGGVRFIPTCVGNIGELEYPFVRYAVHPHVCGEHETPSDIAFNVAGSSPRVWGT